MKVGIIGAGFTGLAAAYSLLKQGTEVTIFEKDAQPGGLAIGYQIKGWDWTLERHYHHWFTSDNFVLNLAQEINHKVIIKRPKTSIYIKGKTFQLDSAAAFLKLPVLPFIDRVRMLVVLGLLRIDPFWKPLEKIRAVDILPYAMGEKAWKTIWYPQLRNKMGRYADVISLVWFWTRINKRSPMLAYPEGGFLRFAEAVVAKITPLGGKVVFNTETISISEDGKIEVKTKDSQNHESTHVFDALIVTVPTFLFTKIAKNLPDDYTKKLTRLEGLSATNLVLRLKQPFLADGTYWLSICELGSPIMAIVEHTNFMDKSHYHNEHLVYLGNYATTDDKLDWSKEKILEFYDPFLKQLQSDYKTHLIDYDFFKAPFAQPIVPVNYSKLILPFTTPLKNVYLANMQQVYPWDRGTNYAVELGKKVADLVLKL